MATSKVEQAISTLARDMAGKKFDQDKIRHILETFRDLVQAEHGEELFDGFEQQLFGKEVKKK